MAEFDVGEHTYRSGTLNAFDQLHIARRLAPVISSFFDILGAVPPAGEASDKLDIFQLLTSEKLEGLAKALAEMPDEQVDYILAKCLSICSRAERDPVTNSVTGWNLIWNKAAKQTQYNITMPEMLQIMQHVLQENIGSFFHTSR